MQAIPWRTHRRHIVGSAGFASDFLCEAVDAGIAERDRRLRRLTVVGDGVTDSVTSVDSAIFGFTLYLKADLLRASHEAAGTALRMQTIMMVCDFSIPCTVVVDDVPGYGDHPVRD